MARRTSWRRAWALIAVAVAAVAGAAAPPPAPPASASAAGNDRAEDIAIGQDWFQRMTVEVGVGGRGPFRFLVDTGAERSAISGELAERLQLPSGGMRTVHSVAGQKLTATVDIAGLTVNHRRFDVHQAPTFKYANLGADGVLGIDGLARQRVMFDFRHQMMSISPSEQRIEPIDKDAIVIVAKTRRGRLIFTDAEADGQRIIVVVDTGSEYSIGNPALARRLFKSGVGPVDTTLQTVTGESMDARIAFIRQLDFGQVKLAHVGVAFADAHIFHQLDIADRPAILLGMNAMRAFDRISIDFTTRKVRFVLPQTGANDGVRMARERGERARAE